ncbi:MAG TPA: S-methyl-5-thioribose-1-phosphate isomerase [Gemmatimonadota bacterium]|nr:S-methyl-5-thioribose-1-phosphate isomerase [Gemmatimonadota bacterium]
MSESTSASVSGPPVPIRFTEDGRGLVILDQTELPGREVERELRGPDAIAEAIRSLRVRGAPLIGITAAMGVAALARAAAEAGVAAPEAGRAADGARGAASGDGESAAGSDVRRAVADWSDALEATRPTAVNLAWALGRMRRAAGVPVEPADGGAAAALADRLREEAEAILEEDRRTCRRIGEHALELLERTGGGGERTEGPAGTVFTHCNAGALATGGIGTALAPVYLAAERGRPFRVVADETRPLLQGSRLTAWELRRAGVEVTVIADGAAGARLAGGGVDAVLVGADRIAANGDVANKVGTYSLAILARHHGVPFYVLAPTSTVDLSTPTGAEIPIEIRDPDEIRLAWGRLTAPEEAEIWSPAFDVTPADLVTAIVTEEGVCRAPYARCLADAVRGAEDERTPAGGAG